MSDGLFWSAREVNGVIEFYRSDTPTKGAAKYIDTPVIFLRFLDDEVVEKTQEEKDAIITAQIVAAQLVAEQSQNELLLAQEALAQAQVAEQLMESNRRLRINALRASYRVCVNEFCKLAGLDVVDKIADPTVMIGCINAATGDTQSQLFMLSMQVKYCLDELRRPSLDGDDAWNRI